ncbi:proteasome subunit beta type-2-like isoform X2 [Bicyclus anynana]|nr:proteasome subunit beta type-2-like isoform X2 [Bicyclus anynana]
MGIKCRDFAMVAADQMTTHSVLFMKDDTDKLHEISEGLLLGLIGDLGDVAQFTQYVAQNLQLYRMRNAYALDTPAVVHFTRNSLKDCWHSGNPKFLDGLIAGYDERRGGELYMIDILASSVRVPYGTQGLGGILSLSIMDRYYKPDLTQQEAYEILKMCIREVQRKLVFNLPSFRVKTVSRLGVRTLPDIDTAMLNAK